jgi:hypothetical protein
LCNGRHRRSRRLGIRHWRGGSGRVAPRRRGGQSPGTARQLPAGTTGR